MNYLAHLKLSGDHEYIMLGNFIADHIRGNKIGQYSPEIVSGIMLHRKIDYFTDHHPEFIKTRERLHPKYHKYAGVIADVFYDHFLAKNWTEYSEFQLSNFTSYSYGVVLRNYSILPSMTKKILPFFIMQNWLASYAKMEGLRRSFQLMARRANFKSNMEFVVDDLIDDYELYEAEFKAFFPDIAAYCQNELDVLFPGDRMSKKNQIISEKAQEFIRQQKEIARLKEEKATQAKMLKEVSKLKKSKAKVDQIASKVEELKPESAQKTEEVKKVKTKRFLLSRKDNS
jgi:acyl carrier protein phosphodiesterase